MNVAGHKARAYSWERDVHGLAHMRSLTVGIVLLVTSLARAEAPVSDEALAAAGQRQVELALPDGNVMGTLLTWDAQRVVIAQANPNRTTQLARRDIEHMRVLEAVPLARRDPQAKERHFGISGGLGLGNLLLDVQTGHFYGFVGTSIGFPILWAESPAGNPAHYFGFVVGAGPSWKLSAHSRWRFDLFALVVPAWWSQFSAGIGVGIGFHYTAPNGLTVGLKLPIIGAGPGCSDAFGGIGESQDSMCAKISGPGALLANFFAQAGMQMPVVSLGYRF